MDICLSVFTGRVPVPYIALIDGVTMGGVSDNLLIFVLIYSHYCILALKSEQMLQLITGVVCLALSYLDVCARVLVCQFMVVTVLLQKEHCWQCLKLLLVMLCAPYLVSDF